LIDNGQRRGDRNGGKDRDSEETKIKKPREGTDGIEWYKDYDERTEQKQRGTGTSKREPS